MMIPAEYQDLLKEPAPKELVFALTLYGTKEIPGKESNPLILSWARELGLSKIYVNDDTAWCGLARAWIAYNADKEIPKNPLWALNWAHWGAPADEPKLGYTAVFERAGGGHVALIVGVDDEALHVLGGNQNNQFNIIRKKKDTLVAIRRPIWKISEPANVRVIRRNAVGELNNNVA